MQTVTVKTNLEIACTDEVVGIACRVHPDWALLVPESRMEVTTEGGLDVAADPAASPRRSSGSSRQTSWSACSSTPI